MLIKTVLFVVCSIVFSPVLLTLIPQQQVQIIEFLQSEVEQIEILPVVEFPFVPQSLIKFDKTEFHFRYIRPNLEDFNPIKTKERKK